MCRVFTGFGIFRLLKTQNTTKHKLHTAKHKLHTTKHSLHTTKHEEDERVNYRGENEEWKMKIR